MKSKNETNYPVYHSIKEVMTDANINRQFGMSLSESLKLSWSFYRKK